MTDNEIMKLGMEIAHCMALGSVACRSAFCGE